MVSFPPLLEGGNVPEAAVAAENEANDTGATPRGDDDDEDRRATMMMRKTCNPRRLTPKFTSPS
jgi:hypothetical protein